MFSVVPARFEIVADVSGGAYSSESVRNVERLTAKFNAVAEGFVKVQNKKPKPKSKVNISLKSTLTAKEKAELFAQEQAEADLRLEKLRKTVGRKVRKMSKVRSRHIARLERELERSKRERESLVSSFTVEPAASSYESDDDDISASDEDDECGDVELNKGTAIEAKRGSRVLMDEVKPTTDKEVETVHQQSVAEILQALKDEESATSDEETDEDESSVLAQSALLSSKIAPLQLWRPLAKVVEPPHNTFTLDETKIQNAKVQKYELTRDTSKFNHIG